MFWFSWGGLLHLHLDQIFIPFFLFICLGSPLKNRFFISAGIRGEIKCSRVETPERQTDWTPARLEDTPIGHGVSRFPVDHREPELTDQRTNRQENGQNPEPIYHKTTEPTDQRTSRSLNNLKTAKNQWRTGESRAWINLFKVRMNGADRKLRTSGFTLASER